MGVVGAVVGILLLLLLLPLLLVPADLLGVPVVLPMEVVDLEVDLEAAEVVVDLEAAEVVVDLEAAEVVVDFLEVEAEVVVVVVLVQLLPFHLVLLQPLHLLGQLRGQSWGPHQILSRETGGL